MRLSAYILAGALALTATLPSEAAVRFTDPAWRTDLGISVPTLANATSAPLELPKAESFMVTTSKGDRRLEDRFDTFDLWIAQTVRGRWRDLSGNVFYLARLAQRPPNDAPGTVRTRADFLARQAYTPFDPDNADHRDEAVFAASPVDLGRPVRPRRSQRRNMSRLFSYPSTNDHLFAAAFRPRSPERGENTDWYLAILVAAPDEPADEAFRRFDEDFLDHVSLPPARARPPSPRTSAAASARASKSSSIPAHDSPDGRTAFGQAESDLLREAVHASVANYDDWHFASAEDVVVIDNLDYSSRATFVSALTNSLPRLRRAYAACAPSPLSFATNHIAVVRVFATREEYLAYVGVQHKWTAALWDSLHRELVLYLPADGAQSLLQTVWHEAFHQHLAYAAALVTAAPWFNEGHAELFEHSHLDRKGNVVFDKDPEAAAYVNAYANELAEMLPEFFSLDYDEFYGGTQEEIVARYRLAWSIAYFLEEGAPKLRFQPFADLRRDYVKALVDTRSMDEADILTLNDDFRKQFISAWLAFWRK